MSLNESAENYLETILILSQKLPEFSNKHLSYLILKVNNIEFKVMDRIMFIWQY